MSATAPPSGTMERLTQLVDKFGLTCVNPRSSVDDATRERDALLSYCEELVREQDSLRRAVKYFEGEFEHWRNKYAEREIEYAAERYHAASQEILK